MILTTFEELETLDLSYITSILCSTHYTLPRWQIESARTCEKKYKRFLWLIKMHPNERLVPTKDIDEFWHNHILHTERYHQDCERIFGFYLHHHPENPEQISEDLMERFKRTQTLYEAAFQEPYLSIEKPIETVTK